MSDALVLGSLPVASPWCLQSQGWNETKVKAGCGGFFFFQQGVTEELLWMSRPQEVNKVILHQEMWCVDYKSKVIQSLKHLDPKNKTNLQQTCISLKWWHPSAPLNMDPYLSLAFLLPMHPQCWRESLGNGWRFLICGEEAKYVIDTKPMVHICFWMQCHYTYAWTLTCPICTLLVCSPGGWPVWTHHRQAFHASWATSQDTGAYTWGNV